MGKNRCLDCRCYGETKSQKTGRESPKGLLLFIVISTNMGIRENWQGEKVTRRRRRKKEKKTREKKKQSADDGSNSLQRNQNKFTYIRKQFPEKS